MTAASPLVFPGSRIVAGWWKQLEAVRPRAIWVGHLLLHHVEALVRLEEPCPLDVFRRHLLELLLLLPGQTIERLAARLHLARPLLGQLLRGLRSDGLVGSNETGDWKATELGARAVQQDRFARITHERRDFYFVESEEPSRPPHFLRLDDARGISWSAGGSWHFDRGTLAGCIARDHAWKARHGFPQDIAAIVDLDDLGASPLWQRVVLDRPERLPIVAVQTVSEQGEDQLVGYAVQQEGWVLHIARAAFRLDSDWPAVFPELLVEPAPDDWREAWSAWCRPRNLPPGDVAACQLQRQDHRLLVTAPPRLVERLRVARSDVFKGESWVLAGHGRLRPAALLELVG